MPTVDAYIYKDTRGGRRFVLHCPNCYRRRNTRGKCKSSGWNSPGSRFQKTREGTFFAHEPNHAKGGCPCTDAATSKRAKKERRRRGLAPKLVLLAHKQALGGDGNDRVLAVFDVPAGVENIGLFRMDFETRVERESFLTIGEPGDEFDPVVIDQKRLTRDREAMKQLIHGLRDDISADRILTAFVVPEAEEIMKPPGDFKFTPDGFLYELDFRVTHSWWKSLFFANRNDPVPRAYVPLDGWKSQFERGNVISIPNDAEQFAVYPSGLSLSQNHLRRIINEILGESNFESDFLLDTESFQPPSLAWTRATGIGHRKVNDTHVVNGESYGGEFWLTNNVELFKSIINLWARDFKVDVEIREEDPSVIVQTVLSESSEETPYGRIMFANTSDHEVEVKLHYRSNTHIEELYHGRKSDTDSERNLQDTRCTFDLAAAEGYTINRDLTFKLAAKANSIVRYLGRGNLETTMSWDDGKSAVNVRQLWGVGHPLSKNQDLPPLELSDEKPSFLERWNTMKRTAGGMLDDYPEPSGGLVNEPGMAWWSDLLRHIWSYSLDASQDELTTTRRLTKLERLVEAWIPALEENLDRGFGQGKQRPPAYSTLVELAEADYGAWLNPSQEPLTEDLSNGGA